MGEAVGVELITGVALLTVTLTDVVAILLFAVLLGVNVTLWFEVPVLGVALGVVKAKPPATLAEPPERVELAKVCPKVIALPVGTDVIDGVALETVTLTVVVAVL